MIQEFTQKDIDYILSPKAIRDRTKDIFEMARNGHTHFKVDLGKMNFAVDYVLKVIHGNYPDLHIPFHSRHGHLKAGGIDRLQGLDTKSKIDLVVVSVLLDAGAGDTWKYFEKSSNKPFARSEGLAVASFHMFKAGAFSKDKKPCADIDGLKNIKAKDLEEHFQVTAQNPLVGVDGRIHLLNSLAKVIEKYPTLFRNGRVGDMLDNFDSKSVKGVDVLQFILKVFGEIWPSRISLGNQCLGDVWSYKPLGPGNSTRSLVPFHKLSQWLSYSVMMPMIEHGIEITGVDELTGLAEYRNGGLMLDLGLIELRDKSLQNKNHPPQSELIIEWRALTVQLLDLLGDAIREKLKMSKEDLPLAKVLEGGTWHAGRKIAKEKREGGGPPLNILSDGTLF